MKSVSLQAAGILALCAACGFTVWRLWPESKREVPISLAKPGVPMAMPAEHAAAKHGGAAFATPYTHERLSEEHAKPPAPEEWPELTRILLDAPDGEIVSAVKARFALHAGTKELAALADAYDAPSNDDACQRVIDVFASLQSGSFMGAARQILTNESLPITDHLVNACAISLARRGEAADVEAIFKRLNSAGDDPDPGGSLYSDADGLAGAICILQNPALERTLCDAAAGRGLATSNRARAAAAIALRSYHTVPVTEVLYELSKNATDPLLRTRAEESLKMIQTPE